MDNGGAHTANRILESARRFLSLLLPKRIAFHNLRNVSVVVNTYDLAFVLHSLYSSASASSLIKHSLPTLSSVRGKMSAQFLRSNKKKLSNTALSCASQSRFDQHHNSSSPQVTRNTRTFTTDSSPPRIKNSTKATS